MTMHQPCDVVHSHPQSRGILVCSCITRRGDVGCPHEHGGYDPSYIREFHIMLVRDSCIRCKGTVWPDVSRHDLP